MGYFKGHFSLFPAEAGPTVSSRLVILNWFQNPWISMLEVLRFEWVTSDLSV